VQINLALLALSLALAGSLYSLPFVRVAANRLVSGEAVYFASFLQGQHSLLAMACTALMVALPVGVWFKPARPGLWLIAGSAALLLPGLLTLAAAHAQAVVLAASPVARTSLGGGFWAAALLAGLIAAEALRRLNASRAASALLLAIALMPMAILLNTGAFNELSIMKEYANRSDVFFAAVTRHVQIVALTLFFTLCTALPLGWAAGHWKRLGRILLPLLNIIQTIPSIALFGLLMAPLALLAANLPDVRRAGISGVGLAPAVIALVLYSLLPVVRATLAGLEAVSSHVLEAARGVGMSASQIFWQVQAPLALPVVLGGVRTATIQAIGLAAVTALIGAGGLGSIMFEGLFASAEDLVLLGVLPIIALGGLADASFKVLIALAAPAQLRQPGIASGTRPAGQGHDRV